MDNQCTITFGPLICCLESGHEGKHKHQHSSQNNNQEKIIRCCCGAGSVFTPDCICFDIILFT